YFFSPVPPPQISTPSLHDALPISYSISPSSLSPPKLTLCKSYSIRYCSGNSSELRTNTPPSYSGSFKVKTLFPVPSSTISPYGCNDSSGCSIDVSKSRAASSSVNQSSSPNATC